MTATKTKFKVGDLVYAPYHGYGMITKIQDRRVYPIIVEWYPDKPFMETTSSFTAEGYLLVGTSKDSNLKITVVKRRHNHRKLLNRFRAFLKGE